MVMKNNPCFGCTTETGRSVGCHSKCKKYIQASKEHEERRQNYIRQLAEEKEICQHVTASIERSKRRGGYKSNVFRAPKKWGVKNEQSRN